MAWFDGELRPVEKDWLCAPVDIAGCEHENGVVSPKTTTDAGVANPGTGHLALYCHFCDQTWWEPLGNIKGSPWEGK